MAIAARITAHKELIWSIADLLRGDYKQSEYGRVILPLVVLRRLDCVLEPTKPQVLARLASLGGRVENVGPILEAITGIEVYNTSPLTLKKILADPSQVAGEQLSQLDVGAEETHQLLMGDAGSSLGRYGLAEDDRPFDRQERVLRVLTMGYRTPPQFSDDLMNADLALGGRGRHERQQIRRLVRRGLRRPPPVGSTRCHT